MHVISIGNNTVNLQIMHSERCGSFIVDAHICYMCKRDKYIKICFCLLTYSTMQSYMYIVQSCLAESTQFFIAALC